MMSSEQKFSRIKRSLRHPLRVAKQLHNLPETEQDLSRRQDEIKEEFLGLNHRNFELSEEVAVLKKYLDTSIAEQEKLTHRIQLIDDRITDAMHQLTILSEQAAEAPAQKSADSPASPKKSSTDTDERLIADDHILDQFYVHFEKWFRGTEDEIAKRQSVYLPYFTDAAADKKLPAIDIGCGNGEFVGILAENNIHAIGLDLNKAMIDRVKEKGLEGVQGDALSYLRDQKSNSVLAITGFHIVEHIPFLDLVRIFNECYRVLAPGGFVIFETPNPENVIVGSCNFYSDPSHLHPLPPAFLELVMKTRGFQKTEIKRLHPLKSKIDHKDPLVQEMAERFFGPQDYAVIAHK